MKDHAASFGYLVSSRAADPRADLIILRFHFYFLCKPRSGSGTERLAHVHALSFPRFEIPRGHRTSGFQEHVASARNRRGASLRVSKVLEGRFLSLLNAPGPRRGLRWQLWTDGCSGQSSCRCYLVTAYV